VGISSKTHCTCFSVKVFFASGTNGDPEEGKKGKRKEFLSFGNRKEVLPASQKKKSTKLVARRPNENQKMTKY